LARQILNTRDERHWSAGQAAWGTKEVGVPVDSTPHVRVERGAIVEELGEPLLGLGNRGSMTCSVHFKA
jgi:hypothetical protein